MDGRRDFTIDPVNFADLPALVDDVKKDGLRFIVILDPAIANDYSTYDRGVASSAYVEWVNATYRVDYFSCSDGQVFLARPVESQPDKSPGDESKTAPDPQ